MPKITRFGGHSNAAAFTEKSSGFVDTTAETVKTAKAKSSVPPVVVSTTEPTDEDDGPPFDPADLTVVDVLALRADCTDDEWAQVLESERQGKARFGILGQ